MFEQLHHLLRMSRRCYLTLRVVSAWRAPHDGRVVHTHEFAASAPRTADREHAHARAGPNAFTPSKDNQDKASTEATAQEGGSDGRRNRVSAWSVGAVPPVRPHSWGGGRQVGQRVETARPAVAVMVQTRLAGSAETTEPVAPDLRFPCDRRARFPARLTEYPTGLDKDTEAQELRDMASRIGLRG